MSAKTRTRRGHRRLLRRLNRQNETTVATVTLKVGKPSRVTVFPIVDASTPSAVRLCPVEFTVNIDPKIMSVATADDGVAILMPIQPGTGSLSAKANAVETTGDTHEIAGTIQITIIPKDPPPATALGFTFD